MTNRPRPHTRRRSRSSRSRQSTDSRAGASRFEQTDPSSIPDQIVAGEDRSADARPDVMMTTARVANGNDTAVTATHSTPHHAFDGDLRGSTIRRRQMSDGLEHRFRAARVHRHRTGRPLQLALEGKRHASSIPHGPIFGREHEAYAFGLEPIEME